MDFHGKIMNIQVDSSKMWESLHSAKTADPRMTYKLGHRDARHAAAELVLKGKVSVDLGFVVDDGIVRFKDGSCRPASNVEIKMWNYINDVEPEAQPG